jgi:molybdopterin converting factor small subunit
MSIDIKLELLATLKRFEPEFPDRFSVRPGITVKELIEILGIPEYEVNLVFVNGAKGNLDTTLAGDDRVGLFPPLGGG